MNIVSKLLLAAALAVGAGLTAMGPACAAVPTPDPNLEHPTQLISAALEGRTISGMVTHRSDARTFRYGVALFAGHPGILRLREEDGALQFDLRGNFLVRSRRHWLDSETLVLVVDAPSDQWGSFTQAFRETERYGVDVAALIKSASERFGISDWTFVGTSEGSISAYHAASLNPGLAKRLILTASVFLSSRNGRGLSAINWKPLPAPLLWVHHEHDPCQSTPYRDARRFAERSASPLVTVRGGGPESGGACEARTAHGFIGVESETVEAMRAWIKTGIVPADVGR